jgi:hypothetical protein
MAAVFPALLPGVSLFDMAAAGQRAQSPPPAHVAQRARTASRWAKARVAWVFEQAELDVFEAWFRSNLKRGSAWFLMRLPSTPDSGDPDAPCYSVCRFPNGYTSPFLVPNGWRVEADLEIRDTAECARVAGGTIGFTSGDDSSPVLPDGAQAGDALLLYVLHRSGHSFAQDNAAAWPEAYNHLDSSANVLRLRCFTRIADGTADDYDTGFTSSDVAAWAMASIHGVNDSYFPDSLVEDRDYKRRSITDLGLVTKENSANHVALACAFLGNAGGSGTFSSVPAGYTALGDVISFTFSQFAMTVTAEMRFAYKLLVGQAEDGGEFEDADSLGSGGAGSVNTLVEYTP